MFEKDGGWGGFNVCKKEGHQFPPFTLPPMTYTFWNLWRFFQIRLFQDVTSRISRSHIYLIPLSGVFFLYQQPYQFLSLGIERKCWGIYSHFPSRNRLYGCTNTGFPRSRFWSLTFMICNLFLVISKRLKRVVVNRLLLRQILKKHLDVYMQLLFDSHSHHVE